MKQLKLWNDPTLRNATAGALFVLMTALALWGVQRFADAHDVELTVDMEVSAGSGFEVYVNERWDQPFRVPLNPGMRVSYHVVGLPGAVRSLRLDPTEASGARVQIYSLTLSVNGQSAQRLGPTEISQWYRSGIREDGIGEAFTGTSENADPTLSGSLDFSASSGPYVLPVLGLPLGRENLPCIFLLLFVIAVLLSQFSATTRFHLLIALVSYGLIRLVVVWFVKRKGVPPSPEIAVGMASWTGYSKSVEVFAFWAGLGTAVVVALLAYAAVRRWSTPLADPPESAMRHRHWVPFAVLIGLLPFYLPDLPGLGQYLSVSSYNGGWDQDNVTVWDYMSSSGWLPYRDFWFPYGFIRSSTSFPFLQLLGGVSAWLVSFEFFLGLYLCTGRRVAFPLLALTTFLVGNQLALFWGWDRYMAAANVALFYCALPPGKANFYRELAFAAVMFHAVLVDPTLLVYSGSAIALKNLLDLLIVPRRSLTEVALDMVRVGRIVGIFLVSFLIYLSWQGQLEGALRFYGDLGTSVAYSASPAPVRTWVESVSGLTPLPVVALILITLGLVVRLTASNPHSSFANMLLLTSTTAFMAMQKMVVRPFGMLEQMLILVVIAILTYIYVLYTQRRAITQFAVWIWLGSLCALAVYWGGPQASFQRWQAGLTHLWHDIAYLRNDTEVEAVRKNQYALERFKGNQELTAVVEEIQADIREKPNKQIFVLGDNPVFYMMLGQKTPYHVNLYNASPIYEQVTITKWLDEIKPAMVIWNPEQTEFDAVPNVVRCPLIYINVIENFVPNKSVGRYKLLRPRMDGEPIAWEYWRTHLGSRVDLGHLARISNANRLKDCDPGKSATCAAFLSVTDNRAGDRSDLEMRVGALDFSVSFARTPAVSQYIVSLDRVWFWKAAAGQGQMPEPRATSPGVQTRIFYKEPDPNLLY